MIYTVVWVPSAIAELARIWTQAPNQAAVSAASNRIDELLRIDPATRGDPYSSRDRILLEFPLSVIFRVSEPDRLVQVLAVGYVPLHTTNGAP